MTDLEHYMKAVSRLSAEVERWKALGQAHNDSLVERIAEVERLKTRLSLGVEFENGLRADNERLREALERIEAQACSSSCRLIARAALRSKGEWENESLRIRDEPPGSATYNERWKSKP
jgi:regulator of replication initiation timing